MTFVNYKNELLTQPFNLGELFQLSFFICFQPSAADCKDELLALEKVTPELLMYEHTLFVCTTESAEQHRQVIQDNFPHWDQNYPSIGFISDPQGILATSLGLPLTEELSVNAKKGAVDNVCVVERITLFGSCHKIEGFLCASLMPEPAQPASSKLHANQLVLLAKKRWHQAYGAWNGSNRYANSDPINVISDKQISNSCERSSATISTRLNI